MNQRIRDLAKQAGFFPELNYDHTQWHAAGYNPNFEKFAELILKECLAHGKLTQSQSVVNGSEEYNAGRAMGIEVFMNHIKLSFGVEQ